MMKENITYNEKKKSIKIDPKLTQILEVATKDITSYYI